MISGPSASPSPKSPEISEKSRKYDRQLRLWGDHGQSKLESSRICLINGNATGTEILKSLVLPGCGSFTIIDDHRVTQEDIGNNFFLDIDCLGNNRGESARLLLLELNPEVSGEAICNNVEHILEQEPTFFNSFTVVAGSDLSEKALKLLSKTLWENRVPFLYCQCIGLIGWIRVQLNEHAVIESHPDSLKEDLRLDVSFPELLTYMNSIIKLDEIIKSPWLVILFKAVQAFLKDNNVQLDHNECPNGNPMDTSDSSINPCRMNRAQKDQFKDFLREYMIGLELGDHDELFQDTIRAMNTALTPTSVPSSVQAILDDNDASTPKASKFWVMCSALKEFVDVHGCLPVRGSLPDMTADSQKYIALQNVYREKADKDAEDMYTSCQELLNLNQTHLKGISLKLEDVRLFCKEACNLRLIRGSPLYQELESPPIAILNDLIQNAEDTEDDKIYYVMIRGLLRFHTEYNNYPGALADYESDITTFKPLMAKLLSVEWNSQYNMGNDYIHEICRYGGSEIPSIAGFIGGCAAQEIIKIVTSQYVPVDNTIIYNAINSTISSFTM